MTDILPKNPHSPTLLRAEKETSAQRRERLQKRCLYIGWQQGQDETVKAIEKHLGCSIEEAKEFIELGKTFAATHQHNKPTCGNTVTDNDKWRFTG